MKRAAWALPIVLSLSAVASAQSVDEILKQAMGPEGDAAEEEAGPQGPPAGVDFEALVASLQDERPKIRAQAALALGAAGHPAPEVIDGLLRALADEQPMVRGSVARALGTLQVPRTFPLLLVAAEDADPFVAKQVAWAIRRVVAATPKIDVGIRGLRCNSPWKSDGLTNAFQAAVLERLLKTGHFDVSNKIDFNDEVRPDEKPLVHVELVAEAEVVGAREAATATATLRATTGGFLLWEGKAVGAGVGRPSDDDEDEDEYTIKSDGDDARLAAAVDLGRAAAHVISVGLAAAGEPPRENARENGKEARKEPRKEAPKAPKAR